MIAINFINYALVLARAICPRLERREENLIKVEGKYFLYKLKNNGKNLKEKVFRFRFTFRCFPETVKNSPSLKGEVKRNIMSILLRFIHHDKLPVDYFLHATAQIAFLLISC